MLASVAVFGAVGASTAASNAAGWENPFVIGLLAAALLCLIGSVIAFRPAPSGNAKMNRLIRAQYRHLKRRRAIRRLFRLPRRSKQQAGNIRAAHDIKAGDDIEATGEVDAGWGIAAGGNVRAGASTPASAADARRDEFLTALAEIAEQGHGIPFPDSDLRAYGGWSTWAHRQIASFDVAYAAEFNGVEDAMNERQRKIQDIMRAVRTPGSHLGPGDGSSAT